MRDRPLIRDTSPGFGSRDRLAALMKEIQSRFKGIDLDCALVSVDDRRPDNSWSVIQALSCEDTNVGKVHLTRNHGQHMAIWAGLFETLRDWGTAAGRDPQDGPGVIPKVNTRAFKDDLNAVIVNRANWKESRILLDGNVGDFGAVFFRMVEVLLPYHRRRMFWPDRAIPSGLFRTPLAFDRHSHHANKTTFGPKLLMCLVSSILNCSAVPPPRLRARHVWIARTALTIFSAMLLSASARGVFPLSGWTSELLFVWFIFSNVPNLVGADDNHVGQTHPGVKTAHVRLSI